MKLLGFCGPAGAGKTTAACAVVGRFPEWTRLSFADPLRAMLVALGLTADELSLRKEEPCAFLGGKTPRYAMQTLGTEWARGMIDSELWLRAAELRVRAAFAAGRSVVFDDVRFDNEAQLIRRLGGQVVRIARPGVEASPAHVSERGISAGLVDRDITAPDVAALRTAVFALIESPRPYVRNEHAHL